MRIALFDNTSTLLAVVAVVFAVQVLGHPAARTPCTHLMPPWASISSLLSQDVMLHRRGRFEATRSLAPSPLCSSSS